MCNKERLLDYLYDELPASDRTAVEAHLHQCRECRTELAELGATRLALSSWSPPDPELGFRIVRNAALAPRRAVWSFGSAWGLAAAAVLVLAAGAAIANIEMRYDANGFVVRSGWTHDSAPAAATQATTVPVNAASEEWKESLRLLDARLQQVEAAALKSRVVRPADFNDSRMSDVELLRAVRKMIADSATDQKRELALRVSQIVRDTDVRRATDLARIEQGLQQVQGLTDAELIRHRETLKELNQLIRVTQRR